MFPLQAPNLCKENNGETRSSISSSQMGKTATEVEWEAFLARRRGLPPFTPGTDAGNNPSDTGTDGSDNGTDGSNNGTNPSDTGIDGTDCHYSPQALLERGAQVRTKPRQTS